MQSTSDISRQLSRAEKGSKVIVRRSRLRARAVVKVSRDANTGHGVVNSAVPHATASDALHPGIYEVASQAVLVQPQSIRENADLNFHQNTIPTSYPDNVANLLATNTDLTANPHQQLPAAALASHPIAKAELSDSEPEASTSSKHSLPQQQQKVVSNISKAKPARQRGNARARKLASVNGAEFHAQSAAVHPGIHRVKSTSNQSVASHSRTASINQRTRAADVKLAPVALAIVCLLAAVPILQLVYQNTQMLSRTSNFTFAASTPASSQVPPAAHSYGVATEASSAYHGRAKTQTGFLSAWQLPQLFPAARSSRNRLNTQQRQQAMAVRRSVATSATSGDAGGSTSSMSSMETPGPIMTPDGRQWKSSAAVRVAAIIPANAASPYKQANWHQVMSHIGQRLEWTDPSFQLLTFTEEELSQQDAAGTQLWQQFLGLLSQGCSMLLGAGLTHPVLTDRLELASTENGLPKVSFFTDAVGLNSPSSLVQLTSLQGYSAENPSLVDQVVSQLLPWSHQAKSMEVYKTVKDLWKRHSSDDLLFVLLVLINQYVTPVKEVAMTTKGMDLNSLRCMITHCRQQIVDCVSTPMCKTALDCLQGCSFNDQVCQYRCIVSYETPQLSEFTLCILQKHNCRNLDAQPPTRPDPAPMTTFRGQPLTHEVAEDMFLGWLKRGPGEGPDPGPNPERHSWLIAAGKNPAYDYFPCQHQLFFKGRAPGVLWYEPVFKAITLDGREVWRRRRYRVRRAQTPGTFHFSVLDNGVTSKEYWRILDCDEGYEWCLFYYSGAASTAGLSYAGAVLGTRDGSYPSSQQAVDRIDTALRQAGIEPWELSFADNSNCVGAPLEAEPVPA